MTCSLEFVESALKEWRKLSAGIRERIDRQHPAAQLSKHVSAETRGRREAGGRSTCARVIFAGQFDFARA
jgi:mRNA-degrading endonuclease RelE of RelBE toxin-antitoxin system